MNRLSGKIIFVTGAAQGIGRDCAAAYAREGARVMIADIDFARAQATAEPLGDAARVVRCDVSDDSSVCRAIAATLKAFGRLDAVHNNAGIVGPAAPLHETQEADWDRLMAVNLKSVFFTTRHSIESLAQSKGCILNTASLVGEIGQARHAAYVATKGAMIALTKAMALDYAPLGVRVNAICPAGVWTPMLKDWAAAQPEPGKVAQYLDSIHPLKYCPSGDVVADVAVFLLSDEARFVTGCAMPVSGGAELGYKR